MRKSLLSPVWLWCLLVIAASTAAAQTVGTPGCTLSQFHAAAESVVPEWVSRVNGNQTLYDAVSNKYFSDGASLVVDYLGGFSPKPIAIEYGDLLYTGEVTLAYGVPYEAVWIGDLQLRVKMPYQLQLDYFGNSSAFVYTAGVFNLVQTEILEFDPASTCSAPKILKSVSLDPDRTRVLNEQSARVKTLDIGSICYALIYFSQCGPSGLYPQYDSMEDCLTFFTQNVPSSNQIGLCPQPFSSKTLLCALVHLTSAFIDPATHCPHVGKNSVPCQDDCLSNCAECALVSAGTFPVNDPSTHAVCVTDFLNNTVRHFKCQCETGTVAHDDLSPVPGRKYCQPIVCSNDQQCKSKPGRAKCLQNKCVVGNGFQWDSSPAAFASKNTVVCPYGEQQVFWDESGVPHCVQPGYCLPGHEYHRWQCSQNGLYDYEQVTCADLSALDYGYGAQVVDSLLGQRDWGCVANYGFSGGLGFPVVCPSPKQVVWTNQGNQICV